MAHQWREHGRGVGEPAAVEAKALQSRARLVERADVGRGAEPQVVQAERPKRREHGGGGGGGGSDLELQAPHLTVGDRAAD